MPVTFHELFVGFFFASYLLGNNFINILGSALILGNVVLIAMIQNFLPEAHPNLPYIGKAGSIQST